MMLGEWLLLTNHMLRRLLWHSWLLGNNKMLLLIRLRGVDHLLVLLGLKLALGDGLTLNLLNHLII